jgi:magnesium transporter
MVVNTLYLPELREMLAQKDEAGLTEFCTAIHPARVAEFMEGLTPEEAWEVLQYADSPLREQIFTYFDTDKQQAILRSIPPEEAARLVANLPPDERVDILKSLDPEFASALLSRIPSEDRRDILRLTAYPENTAGAIMTSAFPKVTGDMTVREALDALARQAAELETIYYVYVVDDQDHLQGVVAARRLLSAMGKPETPVRQLAETSLITAHVLEDKEEVAQKVARFDLLAIPVVDDENRILGIITHDDIIDVVVDEATEDVHRMGGITPFIENVLEAPFFLVWRKRVGWLAALFVAELFTFTALAYFEEAIAAVIALSLFVPLVISTGGNSGSQAATLMTRALALRQVTPRDWGRVLRHELVMGLALGITLGAIGFVRAALTPESVLGNADRWLLALTVGQAVACVCLWGSLVGALLPLILRALGFDPGFASSPFVATFVDCTGIIIYFNIAHFWLF